MPKNNKKQLEIGEKYNLLTIISFSHSDKRWRKFYNVKCDCGNETKVMVSCFY